MSGRRVTLGRVAGVFGVRGWVKVYSYTRPMGNILDYPRWHLVPPQGREGGFEAQLIEGQVQGRGLVAQLSDAGGAPITDRDAAVALVGWQIEVDRGEMPRLPKGQYYWIDLIGLKVENAEGVALGQVSDVTSNGAQDVLVVNDGERERLIPFVSGPIVKKVDLKAGRIVCDWQPDY